MEIKWTPWRGAYIKGSTEPEDGCVLCNVHEAGDDRAKLVLYRGRQAFVMMNLYPYNPGHLMIVPFAHTADFASLDSAISGEVMRLSQQCAAILQREMRPHGFNLGMNLGRVSGAGVDQHLHMHIVPRWNGDTNFMPLIGGVKLIPESLDDTYESLRPHFDTLDDDS